MALHDGATVAVIGGGPAGAFFCIRLLGRARELGRRVRVVLVEHRRQRPAQTVGPWRDCKCCAGGISPRLSDVLDGIRLPVPDSVVQGRIRSITIQSDWKNIELLTPPGRRMLCVFRGTRPAAGRVCHDSFDTLLTDRASAEGAELLTAEVLDATRGADGRPIVHYRTAEGDKSLAADFLVFASGVNEPGLGCQKRSALLGTFQRLVPAYRPPRLRASLIFELELPEERRHHLEGQLHFVEYGSAELPLEMCSLLPKREYVTVVLVGRCVDAAKGPLENKRIIEGFLALPHIRQLLAPGARWRTGCVCNPRMVVGSAVEPCGDRVAAIGDLAAARLYKDGMLSAYETACALADAMLERGVDRRSLVEGYLPQIRQFRRDNRYASALFLLHRLVFSSSVLSRVLYQAVITERKTTVAAQRRLERLLWNISSGDAPYEATFWSLIHPATVWAIVAGGLWITARNYATERFFRLEWERLGRFTTGVALERLARKSACYWREIAEGGLGVEPGLEFERMYTIRIRADTDTVERQLGRFGDPDRRYFRPRWVDVRRIRGVPNEPGCTIRYEILGGRFSFEVELEQPTTAHRYVYRVVNGFARGGVLLFEIEPVHHDVCDLSIYVGFRFRRGRGVGSRAGWWLFRTFFPAYVHDVIWNHSLCELKGVAEAEVFGSERPAAEPAAR